MNNALPVGENLKAQNINSEMRCPYCGEEETTAHMLFHCNHAAQIWRIVPCKDQIEPLSIGDIRAGIEMSPYMRCLPPIGVGEGPIFPWIVWRIWIARNQLMFDNKHQTIEETVNQAIILAKEWQMAQHHTRRKESAGAKRIPTLRKISGENKMTCKTDASWREDKRSAGFGWIMLRQSANQAEEIVEQGGEARDHIRSPLTAEGVAILTALTRARDIGIKQITVASDSHQLIRAINKEFLTKEFHGILHDILDLSKVFEKIEFVCT
ncbi:unnamed protein product [Microthlaspi erraticum]|uniref:RNase H type-1 domain-containing protein n=1 Tax=Microthlaspi erraticum TaxID=1685480 RepID=A0A6D2KC94_9BRAS|nr:unnamed protein product [Microthlaspi erraticum]